jgi:ribose-phosphate pyrophosphokinase
MKIIAGNSNPNFAETVAKYIGIEICDTQLKTFSDEEISVRISENIRGEDVFIIQSTCAPANDNLMELLVCIDALKRASARRITAVMPYFGYARQDRKTGGRTAISAKLVADLLTAAGANRVLTMDLHTNQIEGFFNIPVDNLMAMPTLAEDIRRHYENVRIISPDVGGAARARALAKKLNVGLAIVDKRREQANTSEVMNIIGDVNGFNCILFDDMVDTGGTLVHAAEALIEAGAESVSAYVSHGVLSGNALQTIHDSLLKEVIITDSIPAPDLTIIRGRRKIRQVSVTSLFGEAIRRVSHEESVSRLST